MLYFITGGERSGKSGYAQQLALSLADNPVYLATAKIWDEDFKARVKRHQDERDHRWTNLEEELSISQVIPPNRVVVVDCVTLWLTNFFDQNEYDKALTLPAIQREFDKIKDYQGTLIIISNEIGMGLHANTKSGRDFVELQGWINQYIAKTADKVFFMVSGIPLKVK